MRFKYQHQKPSRDQLWGMSASQFKTMLKRRGYKISRDFFKQGSVAQRDNRLYRFRYWGGVGEFFVDVSCPISQFDRWANSTDRTINFYNWIENEPTNS
jgi:hypothetical protein